MRMTMKKVLSLVLALMLLVGMLPHGTVTAQTLGLQVLRPCGGMRMTVSSALDGGRKQVVDAWEGKSADFYAQSVDISQYGTLDDAVATTREQMAAREAVITVYIHSTEANINNFLADYVDEMFVHTGNPREGDSLRWQYATWSQSVEGMTDNAGNYYYAVTNTLTYYTTADEEAAVDVAVDELLSSLDVSAKTDYEKVKAVYDWLCANVTYDYENLEDTTYLRKFSAYAALIDRTSVCQGYAVLFYRLMLELDVNARLIAGVGGGGDHSWNIVALGGKYYNLDATWDAGRTEYSYFLCGDTTFDDHTRDAEYQTTEFYAIYPMSDTDYVPSEQTETACQHTSVETYEGYDATCTIEGMLSYWHCLDCGCYALDEAFAQKVEYAELWIAPLGHDYVDGACSRCGILDLSTLPENACGDNLTWTFDEETGTLTISGTGPMWDFYWTEEDVLDRPWNDIADSILHVVIEDGVTSVGDDAFSRMSSLTSVSFGNTLERIGYFAFFLCTSLGDFTLPQSMVSIHQQAFYGCERLTTIVIPSGVCFLGSAFSYCKNLAYVEFKALAGGSFVMSNGLFTGCTSLEEIIVEEGHFALCAYDGVLFSADMKTVHQYPCGKQDTSWTVPDGVTCIFQDAFWGAVYLQEVYLPESVTEIMNNAFYACKSLQKVSMQEGVQTIGQGAFLFCDSLIEIVLPTSVTSLGEQAISNCDGLQSITFQGDAPTIAGNTFYGITATVYYPADNATWTEDVMQDYGGTITWEAYETVTPEEPPVEIVENACGDNLTWTFDEETGTLTISGTGPMWDYADDGDDVIVTGSFRPASETESNPAPWNGDEIRLAIKKVVIGAGVTYIGEYAFMYCYSLVEVEFAENCVVTEIGANAFMFCSKLSEVAIPDGVTAIGSGAFRGCGLVGELIIPASVVTIGANAFNENGISSVTFVENSQLTTIENGAFRNCDCLTEITIPASVTTIGNHAFNSCDAMVAFYVEAGNLVYTAVDGVLYTIDMTTLCRFPCGKSGDAFAIPATVTTIGYGAFSSCLNLNTFTIADGVTVIGDYAFASCRWLETLELPANLTSIGKGAFQSCASLARICIPASVEKVGSLAFASCTSLTDIYVQSATVASKLTATYDCGRLLEYAVNVYIRSDITEVPEFVTATYPDTASVRVDGVEYTLYHVHAFETLLEEQAATCTEEGYRKLQCYCGQERTETIGLADHSFVDGVCAVCCLVYAEYNADVTVGELVVSDGGQYATADGDEVYIDMNRLAQTYGVTTFAAFARVLMTMETETDYWQLLVSQMNADGYTLLTEQTLAWLEAFIAQKNAEAEGSAVAQDYLVSKPATTYAHTYTAVVTQPTCTTAGYTVYTCACGHSYTEETAATGHVDAQAKDHICDVCGVVVDQCVDSDGNGICDWCGGEVEPANQIGDLNGDGRVDSYDAIYLLYNTFYEDDYPVNQDCDFNGDGRVDSYDAIYLLYYTFYPEDYPLN